MRKTARLGGFFRAKVQTAVKPLRVAGDAVLIAPVSRRIPLQTGYFTGKFAIFGAQRPNLRLEGAALQLLVR